VLQENSARPWYSLFGVYWNAPFRIAATLPQSDNQTNMNIMGSRNCYVSVLDTLLRELSQQITNRKLIMS
jgi:hypothetical protein